MQIHSAVPETFHTQTNKNKQNWSRDVLPNINCMLAAALLLLLDVICSERFTTHFQQGANLSLVTLTFDLDIQTRPSEGPNMSSL